MQIATRNQSARYYRGATLPAAHAFARICDFQPHSLSINVDARTQQWLNLWQRQPAVSLLANSYFLSAQIY